MARVSSSKKPSDKPEGRNLAPIIVAVIGVVGPICAAYIGYLAVQSQIQAAKPTPVPSPVVAVTSTPAVADAPTAAPTRAPDVVVPPTPVQAVPLRLSITESCLIGKVIPDALDPEHDPVGARAAVDRSTSSGGTRDWQRTPRPGQIDVRFNLFLTSLASKEWVQVGNSLDFSVVADATVPDHVNVLQDCAGGGAERAFPPVPLDSSLNRYTKSTTFPEFPFFTLQPGEFESFVTPFECRAPGVYRIHGDVHYLYAGVQDTIGYTPPVVMCPKSVTHWSALIDAQSLQREESVMWRGDRYVDSVP